MKEIRLSQDKNEHLKIARGIDFETVIKIIKNDKQVKVVDHPNKKRYSKQRIFFIWNGFSSFNWIYKRCESF